MHDDFKLKKPFWSPWLIQKYFSVVRVKRLGVLRAKIVFIPKVTLKVINQDRMFFADFSVNFPPIFMKFCNNHISAEFLYP